VPYFPYIHVNIWCRPYGVPADLGTEAGVESAITTSLSQLGGIDILVLNHIIGFFGSWMEESKRLPMDVWLSW
jgi:NAD(P)-dependent dehydrogenase (short-subunit alcohol dehydrogenase family)